MAKTIVLQLIFPQCVRLTVLSVERVLHLPCLSRAPNYLQHVCQLKNHRGLNDSITASPWGHFPLTDLLINDWLHQCMENAIGWKCVKNNQVKYLSIVGKYFHSRANTTMWIGIVCVEWVPRVKQLTHIKKQLSLFPLPQLPSVWRAEGRADPGVPGGHSHAAAFSVLPHAEAPEETNLPELVPRRRTPRPVLGEAPAGPGDPRAPNGWAYTAHRGERTPWRETRPLKGLEMLGGGGGNGLY